MCCCGCLSVVVCCPLLCMYVVVCSVLLVVGCSDSVCGLLCVAMCRCFFLFVVRRSLLSVRCSLCVVWCGL